MIRTWLLVLVWLTWLCACSNGFAKYNAGIGTLYIGDRVAVEQECLRRRTVVPSTDSRIFGCADLVTREIFSVADPAVIAHEFCHLSRLDGDHSRCPTPVLP